MSQQGTTYQRAINITAYDFKVFKASKELRQVWKVSVTSEGWSGDLREVMPVLLAQARPYFGKSTGRKIDVKSRPDGPEVQAVRTGAPPVRATN